MNMVTLLSDGLAWSRVCDASASGRGWLKARCMLQAIFSFVQQCPKVSKAADCLAICQHLQFSAYLHI